MATISLTDELRAEYERLYAEADIPDDKQPTVAAAAQKILAHWTRYETVAATLGIPPHPIALIHAMESGCDFSRHLHNGDPLTARTVHEPPNRPASGEPPYTWEASAMDALRMHGLDKWDDWSISGLCYVLERYNGWGYRKYHPTTKSPYLWACTSIYSAGKYVADGKWSATAVSQQVGAIALLMEIVRQGHPYPVEGVADADSDRGVAAALDKPAASVLPAEGLQGAAGDGQAVGGTVGADLQPRARLIAILTGLSKSKTMYGVIGMLGLQILGPDGLDWGFYHGNDLYSLSTLSPYISSALAALATWGRISAKPIGGKTDA